MNKSQYLDFLARWQEVVFILAFVALGLAVLNYIAFKVKFATLKTYKEQFDLTCMQQTKMLFRTHVVTAIAIFLFANTVSYETMKVESTWFFVRLFVVFCIGFLYVYVAHLLLKFYYPSKLMNRLHKLRYTPRVNPKNGKKMQLLNEEEEDAYLNDEMLGEEKFCSVDYDVWIDPSTGDTKIEKYESHRSILECDRCQFKTLRLVQEEVTKEASETEGGELLREYKCSYCNRIKRKTSILSHKIKEKYNVTHLVDDSFPHDGGTAVVKVEIHEDMIDSPFAHGGETAVVKVEIREEHGKVQEFDFQNIDQARHFLEEFNSEALEKEH